MEALASPCYSDMGVEQSFLHQWDLTTALDQLGTQHLDLEIALGQDLERSPSSESYTSYPSSQSRPPPPAEERPKKMVKTSSWSSCTTEHNPAPRILSFGNPDSPPVCQTNLFPGGLSSAPGKKKKEDLDGPARTFEAIAVQGAKRAASMGGASRSAAHNQEHIMAERKRREKLSQRFIELSAIVPGLKKMDKASVLSDAIKYLKNLQDRVTTLEDQAVKRSVESAVLVKKSQLCVDDDTSSCDENSNERQSGESLPEIEARVCGKTILIKIHCENRKGVLVKALSEIEKLHLSVMNTSVIPFTASSLDITVMSQMEEEFAMTPKEVVKKLNAAFRQLME